LTQLAIRFYVYSHDKRKERGALSTGKSPIRIRINFPKFFY